MAPPPAAISRPQPQAPRDSEESAASQAMALPGPPSPSPLEIRRNEDAKLRARTHDEVTAEVAVESSIAAALLKVRQTTREGSELFIILSVHHPECSPS